MTVTGNTAKGDIQVNNNTVGVGGTLKANSAGINCELHNDSPTIEGAGGANTAETAHTNTCNRNA